MASGNNLDDAANDVELTANLLDLAIADEPLAQKTGIESEKPAYSRPLHFLQDCIELFEWRAQAADPVRKREYVQLWINQVMNAHPTALLTFYLDWRQTIATERLTALVATLEERGE